MGSLTENSQSARMGNAAARQRLKAHDFKYTAKNTAFLTESLVEEYFAELISNNTGGKISQEEFKKIFNLAFPERPADKVEALTKKIANEEKTDGTIPLCSIALMIYLFCDGKTEENLSQGNADMATVMAEVYNLGDRDRNEKLERTEFINGMMGHPVTKKLLEIKTIDALLSTY